jgi:PTS system mannose-specific IID component
MDNTKRKKITRFDLFKVFTASFFMQAVWNFRSLLSIGFSLSFFPVLDKLCSTPQAKREFFQRHLKFFNAHPYFASFALGISIRLEESRALGDQDQSETIDRLKDLLIGPLGALGDRLFWATIKPASLILGMIGIYLSPTIPFKILSLVFTFLLYNIPHFYYRYRGIIEGYEHPLDIYKFVSQNRFEGIRKFFVILFTMSLAIFVLVYSESMLDLDFRLIFVFLGSAVLAFILEKFWKNFYLVTLVLFVIFIVTGILLF